MRNKSIGILVCGLLVITSFPIVNGYSDRVEVIDQEQVAGYKWSFMGTTSKIAQSFKPTLDTLTCVDLYLKRTATTGVVKVSIRENLEYGEDLISFSFDISHVRTTWEWIKFNFDDINVTPEKIYFIVLYKDSSWSGTNTNTIYYWFNENDNYSRGVMLKYDNNWQGIEGYDLGFKTYGLDYEPNNPTITGETNGDIQTWYNYTLQTTDPEQNDVQYFIDWGDNENTTTDFNENGKETIVRNMWDLKGTYNIKVKAIDVYGAESDWTNLTVTMPCSYNIPVFQFWEKLFQRFPHAFPILRNLLGY